MSAPCIHGFVAGQCASCRTCQHGLVASRCVECTASADASPRESEDREGWEIFYAPEVSGWRVRAPEAAELPDSYRSLFLARKAVDALVANPPVAARSAKRGR